MYVNISSDADAITALTCDDRWTMLAARVTTFGRGRAPRLFPQDPSQLQEVGDDAIAVRSYFMSLVTSDQRQATWTLLGSYPPTPSVRFRMSKTPTWVSLGTLRHL
ncbi:hypothetical protein PsYK624_028260 [Phanerochaete sordida]|uniref:Uncharacterized protein n=1 Tax=Phanerochaete sordida TaxID=48140 RepID=A0A9P3G319_9APHY|nr:hypothetical protein PsYK624_028260 [Phanerochaete sordida]